MIHCHCQVILVLLINTPFLLKFSPILYLYIHSTYHILHSRSPFPPWSILAFLDFLVTQIYILTHKDLELRVKIKREHVTFVFQISVT